MQGEWQNEYLREVAFNQNQRAWAKTAEMQRKIIQDLKRHEDMLPVDWRAAYEPLPPAIDPIYRLKLQ